MTFYSLRPHNKKFAKDIFSEKSMSFCELFCNFAESKHGYNAGIYNQLVL